MSHPDNNDDTTGFILRIRILSSDAANLAFNQEGEGEEASAIGSDDHEVLRRMEQSLMMDLHLTGVPGIKKVYISKKPCSRWDDEEGEFKSQEEWVLRRMAPISARFLRMIKLITLLLVATTSWRCSRF